MEPADQAGRFLAVGLIASAAGLGFCSEPGSATGDPRLAKTVSLEASGRTLPAVLQELERQSDVELVCEAGLSHRRLQLLVRNRPLSEVLNQIAAFSGFGQGRCVWRPGGEGEPRYTLREDKASRDARELLRNRRDRDFMRRFRLAQAAAAMTPEELVKLRRNAPRLAHSPPRSNMRLLVGFPAAALRRVFNGQVLDVPYDDLSPAQQQIIRDKISRVRFTTSIASDDGPDRLVSTYDGSRDFPSSRLIVRLSGAPDRPGLSVRVRLTDKSGFGTPNILDPWQPPPDEQPEWLREGLRREEQARLSRYVKSPAGGDPALQPRVTIRRAQRVNLPDGRSIMRYSNLPRCLKQLSEQTGLPIIAHYDPSFEDYYARTGLVPLKSDLSEVTVLEAMQRMSAHWDVGWDKEDGWLHVRSERVAYAEMDRLNLGP
jgi:hypothetical protein